MKMTMQQLKDSNASLQEMLAKMKPGKPATVCCHCGRVLTDPDSVKAGIGPECAAREEEGA